MWIQDIPRDSNRPSGIVRIYEAIRPHRERYQGLARNAHNRVGSVPSDQSTGTRYSLAIPHRRPFHIFHAAKAFSPHSKVCSSPTLLDSEPRLKELVDL